jgi:hypothetical protein
MKITENRIKKIIEEEIELMEMEIDPYTIMMGAGGLYALYKMFFGREPDSNKHALDAVRNHIASLEAQADAGDAIYKNLPKPPGQGDFQKIKAKQRLDQLKKQLKT